MAMKKKKKDKKEKKVIPINFETSRLTKGLDFRKAQIELYENASIEEIEDAMNYHGILLHADQVVSDYKPIVNVDCLEEKYHEQYSEELEALNQKKLVMDEDCIYFFITKVIEENFDVSKLADPEYIVDRLNDYFDQPNQFEYFSQILKNIIHLKGYTEETDLTTIFWLTEYDIQAMLADIICQDLVHQDLSLAQVKSLLKDMTYIIECFQLNSSLAIYSSILELLASFGLDASLEAFEKGKQLFFKRQLTIYNAFLVGLSKDSEIHPETKEKMKQYYQEVLFIERSNPADEKIFKMIQEHFSYLA